VSEVRTPAATAAPGRRSVRDLLPSDWWKVVFAWAAVVLLFVVGGILKQGFLSRSSIQSVLVVASFTGFVAAGQVFVILVGGIDFSVPWVLNAAAILLVTSSHGQNSEAVWGVLLSLALGLGIGALNGIGVAYLSIPAVVMTLGMNGIMQGLTLGLSKGLTCDSCTASAPPAVSAVINGHVLGVPSVLIVWLGIAVLVSLVLGITIFGRRVYAIGNSPAASFLAGVNVKRVTVALYMISGMFAAFGGIALTAYGGQPTLGLGDPYLLQSVAAIVIGGVSILGGRGLFLGTVAGAVILTTLVTLLRAENMPEYGRNIVYGLVILLILVAYGRERRGR
jgi:ribose transport system permease protein